MKMKSTIKASNITDYNYIGYSPITVTNNQIYLYQKFHTIPPKDVDAAYFAYEGDMEKCISHLEIILKQTNQVEDAIGSVKKSEKPANSNGKKTGATQNVQTQKKLPSNKSGGKKEPKCSCNRSDLLKLQKLFPHADLDYLGNILSSVWNDVEKCIATLNNTFEAANSEENMSETSTENSGTTTEKPANSNGKKTGATKNVPTQKKLPSNKCCGKKKCSSVGPELLTLQKLFPQAELDFLGNILSSEGNDIEKCIATLNNTFKATNSEESMSETSTENSGETTPESCSLSCSTYSGSSAESYIDLNLNEMDPYETKVHLRRKKGVKDHTQNLKQKIKMNPFAPEILETESSSNENLSSLSSGFVEDYNDRTERANSLSVTSEQLKLYRLYPSVNREYLNQVLLFKENDIEACISCLNSTSEAINKNDWMRAESQTSQDSVEKNLFAAAASKVPTSDLSLAVGYKETYDKELELHRLYPGLDELTLNQILASVDGDKNECIELINSSLGLDKPPKYIMASSHIVYRPITNKVPFSSNPVVMLIRFKANVQNDSNFAANSPMREVIKWLQVEKFQKTCALIESSSLLDREGFDYLELHHKTKNEASILFNTYVFLKYLHLMQNQLPKVRFKVFTGQGNRSKNRKGILLGMISNFLIKYKFTYEHFKTGRFLVTIKPFCV